MGGTVALRSVNKIFFRRATVLQLGTVILTLERMHYAYKLKISRGISYVTQQSKMKV